MSILIAGGAGYTGAHVARLLFERGEEVVAVDDLSYGTSERVKGASLVELDVVNGQAPQTLAEVMNSHGVTAVIHLAARKQVGESAERSIWYYQQNVGGLANMLLAMETAGAKQMIFSSSIAAYGMPPMEVVPGDIDCRPINLYGEAKLIGERMIADVGKVWGLRWADLRYFNVAGAGWGDLGDIVALNLIPMVLDRLAKDETPKIFGINYPTPDDICVRDYIHIKDLAITHIAALDYLAGGQETAGHVFNVGTGQGASVREVVSKVIASMGLDPEPEKLVHRAGDPLQLIGNATRIGEVLGWRTEHNLDGIVASPCTSWQADPNRPHFG